MMIVEMAAYFKKQGKTLLDVLNDIYAEFGFYNERQVSLELEGVEGQERIARMMEEFREHPLTTVGAMELEKVIDFKDGSWYALRPSGTEPKIKLYIYSIGKDEKESVEKLDLIEKACREKMDSVK